MTVIVTFNIDDPELSVFMYEIADKLVSDLKSGKLPHIDMDIVEQRFDEAWCEASGTEHPFRIVGAGRDKCLDILTRRIVEKAAS